MVAHSACDFRGGRIEQMAMAKYRRDLWQGRVSNSRKNDVELRKNGKCPLTPEEVGLMLAALGFNSNTQLYVATYKVFFFRIFFHFCPFIFDLSRIFMPVI
jgi:hypothetical protein